MNYLRNTKRCINYSWRCLMVDSCNFNVNKEVSIFIDTKNYSTARNMFKNLGQYKAYLREINNFDQLYIIQQGGRGVTRKEAIEKLESAIAKDAEGVYKANESIWLNMKIGSYKKLEDLAKTKKLSTSTKYSSFQESIKVTF